MAKSDRPRVLRLRAHLLRPPRLAPGGARGPDLPRRDGRDPLARGARGGRPRHRGARLGQRRRPRLSPRASGIPQDDGLIKNRYVARTFIQPGQELRKHGLRLKFNPLPEVVAGKRLVVVDDSIVRGNTTRQIVQMLRDAGAAEVHMRISAPPIRHPVPLRDRHVDPRGDDRPRARRRGDRQGARLRLAGLPLARGRLRGDRPAALGPTATPASAASTRWPGPPRPTGSSRSRTSCRSCAPSRLLPAGGRQVQEPAVLGAQDRAADAARDELRGRDESEGGERGGFAHHVGDQRAVGARSRRSRDEVGGPGPALEPGVVVEAEGRRVVVAQRMVGVEHRIDEGAGVRVVVEVAAEQRVGAAARRRGGGDRVRHGPGDHVDADRGELLAHEARRLGAPVASLRGVDDRRPAPSALRQRARLREVRPQGIGGRAAGARDARHEQGGGGDPPEGVRERPPVERIVHRAAQARVSEDSPAGVEEQLILAGDGGRDVAGAAGGFRSEAACDLAAGLPGRRGRRPVRGARVVGAPRAHAIERGGRGDVVGHHDRVEVMRPRAAVVGVAAQDRLGALDVGGEVVRAGRGNRLEDTVRERGRPQRHRGEVGEGDPRGEVGGGSSQGDRELVPLHGHAGDVGRLPVVIGLHAHDVGRHRTSTGSGRR